MSFRSYEQDAILDRIIHRAHRIDLKGPSLVPIPEGEAGQVAWLVGLAGALNDFQGALAIDPGNARALANLEAVYALLGQVGQYPVAIQTASVPADLRELYDRAVARLPRSRSELDERISEIRSLRGEIPKRPE
jgi:hypothetical protein